MNREIRVRFRQAGFHYWPLPTPHRDYLGQPHRHVFHVEAMLPVEHDDREVEFHDLLEVAQGGWPGDGENLGPLSCEQIAACVARNIRLAYPHRPITVAVFEDGENGAVLSWEANEDITA